MSDTRHSQIIWRLGRYMDAHSITRYALQKSSGIAMNTIRPLYDGSTQRPDLSVLASLMDALERITGQPVKLSDLLERVSVTDKP